MTGPNDILREARVRAYLTQVHREVAAIDPSAADGVMREVAEHIREAASEPGFDVDAVLAELGDAALIAAAVEPARVAAMPASSSPAPGRERFVDSTAAVWLTALALTVGTFAFNVIGWVVAMVVLWSSRRFGRTDIIIGTAVWPVVLIGVALGPAFGVYGAWHAVILLGATVPVAVAIWLVVRGLRGGEVGGGAGARRGGGMPVGDDSASHAAALASRGWLDRWPAAVVVIGGPVAALIALLPLAMTGNASLRVIPFVLAAVVVLIAATAVLWRSAAWALADRLIGTALLAAFTVATALAFIAAPTSYTCMGPCGAQPAPAGAQLLIQLVIPLIIAHAVLMGVRWARPSGHITVRIRRGAAAGIVALVVAGGVGFPLLLLARFSMTGGLIAFGALAVLGVWAAGVVLVWRADGWTGLDRAVATFVWPTLFAVPLALPLATAADRAIPVNPLLPGETVTEPQWVLAWAVFGVIEAVLALWLLIRFEPRAPGETAGADARDGTGASARGR